MLSDKNEYWNSAVPVFISLNALSSIVCFLTHFKGDGRKTNFMGSQCPLEHCMLSDDKSGGPRIWTDENVSMPSRALYAF